MSLLTLHNGTTIELWYMRGKDRQWHSRIVGERYFNCGAEWSVFSAAWFKELPPLNNGQTMCSTCDRTIAILRSVRLDTTKE